MNHYTINKEELVKEIKVLLEKGYTKYSNKTGKGSVEQVLKEKYPGISTNQIQQFFKMQELQQFNPVKITLV